MKKTRQIILMCIMVVVFSKCKNDEEGFSCECNGPDVSQIIGETGTIVETGGEVTPFVILRDSDLKKYYSCTGISEEYRIGDLNIVFSGSVKLPCPNAFYAYELLKVTEIKIE
jgi:hypothetical protein